MASARRAGEPTKRRKPESYDEIKGTIDLDLAKFTRLGIMAMADASTQAGHGRFLLVRLLDGLEKRPIAALRFSPRHGSVP
jgi:hypothetical protein